MLFVSTQSDIGKMWRRCLLFWLKFLHAGAERRPSAATLMSSVNQIIPINGFLTSLGMCICIIFNFFYKMLFISTQYGNEKTVCRCPFLGSELGVGGQMMMSPVNQITPTWGSLSLLMTCIRILLHFLYKMCLFKLNRTTRRRCIDGFF